MNGLKVEWFYYDEPILQNGFSLCWTSGGCVYARIVLAELNWTVLKHKLVKGLGYPFPVKFRSNRCSN